MSRPVLLAVAWPPELRRWEEAVAASPALATRAVARAVGVGLVEAAVGAARVIAEERPRAVVFVGTAGGYPGRRWPLGSAAGARRLLLLSSAVARGEAYFPRPMPTVTLPDRRLAAALRGAADLPAADVVCPLGITTAPPPAQRGARLENLEAFAVARAAAAAAVPFAAVLGVSNAVGAGAHQEWREHGAAAAAAASEAVIAWLRGPTPRPRGRRAAPPPAPARRARRSPA
jgi:futalosine hydrolase